jgi:hypothetical protein
MLSNEILRTCNNEHIAAAALGCIGGALEHRVARAAQAEGLSNGAYVARVVRAFPQKTGPAGLSCLQQRIDGDEMPILAGLALIVETALQERPGEV